MFTDLFEELVLVLGGAALLLFAQHFVLLIVRRLFGGEPSLEGRRFQFSLRTLMIVMTLFAAVCAYVGYQAKVVRDRQAVLADVEKAGGGFFSDNHTDSGFWNRFPVWPEEAIASIDSNAQQRSPARSIVRSLLGDGGVLVIWLPAATSPTEEARIRKYVPEAYVWRFK